MESKYMIIYNEIKKRIVDGIYKENQQIPDEKSLCREFDCSRMTVKKALDILVREGMLHRKRGLGSFVMSKSSMHKRTLLQEDELLGLTRSLKEKVKSNVLEFDLMFADEKIAQNLNINVNDSVYNILRLRYIGDKPCILERTYMSTNLITGINKDVLEGSIYNYIEQELGYKIASAKKMTRADVSTAFDQEMLELKEIEPVLEIEQIAYLDNGTPFEYSISRHRYDYFDLTTYSVRR
ncbi:GntR family transcriptional regulator [Peptostreptococcus russellii]|nr:GntR family transcriptional regulator [Peptostreptococcus russellii]